MPALTFEGEFINLSYADDALTFYPNFPYYEGDYEHKLRNCLEVVEACRELNFVIKRLPNYKSTSQNEAFITSLEKIYKQKSSDSTTQNPFNKIVRRNDDDHMMYHREEGEDRERFRLDASHWHIKFTSLLNLDQISTVLDVFINRGLISENEKSAFLAKVTERYAKNRKALDNQLAENNDPETILTFIQNCKDNDVLANLHCYLSQPKFDYLRMQQEKSNAYQGTHLEGQLVPTSKTWAKIEKAIALQISNNIRTQCTNFTPKLGQDCAKRLDQQFKYFSPKRKAIHGSHLKNGIYHAMVKGDAEKLEKKYTKLFKTS